MGNATIRENSISARERDASWKYLSLDYSTHLGVVGGNAAGAALKDYTLGNLGNTIAGAIGGVRGGQILQVLIPAIAGAAGRGLDVGATVGQIVGGGAGGAILTIIAGVVKAMMGSQQTR